MNQFEDVEKVCQEKGCGAEFIWTAGEQKFMSQLKQEGKVEEVNPPKRCMECRAKKKAKYGDTNRRPVESY